MSSIVELFDRQSKKLFFLLLGIWIHIEAEHTPEFDGNGFVVAPDRVGTLINELGRFLDVAAANNVFVAPVLWNGALMRNQRYRNLVLDDARLQSYINNALIVSCKGDAEY